MVLPVQKKKKKNGQSKNDAPSFGKGGNNLAHTTSGWTQDRSQRSRSEATRDVVEDLLGDWPRFETNEGVEASPETWRRNLIVDVGEEDFGGRVGRRLDFDRARLPRHFSDQVQLQDHGTEEYDA